MQGDRQQQPDPLKQGNELKKPDPLKPGNGLKKPDPLLLLARAHATQGRKRSRVTLLIAVAVILGLLALIAWLNWPGPEPVPLVVSTGDQLALPGETITLRAWLRPPASAPEGTKLANFDLYFVDRRTAGPQRLQELVATGPDGEATVRWNPPAAGQPHSVVVRYPGDKGRPRSYDTARVHVWPAGANLLVVEARHGILDASPEKFRKSDVSRLKPAAGVSAALKEALARKYRIVYLATAPDRPEDYRKLRDWLQRRSPAGLEMFPDGPVLGRADYADDSSAAQSQTAILQGLKRRFKGKIVGIVRRAEDARRFQKEGLTTILIGTKADAPAHVKAVKSWRELTRALP